MDGSADVGALAEAARAFGRGAARRKLALLRRIGGGATLRPRELAILQDACSFLRAYPDDQRVLSAARATVAAIRQRMEALGPRAPGSANRGLPGAVNTYPYSYGELQQVVREWPGSCEIAWEDLDDETENGLLAALRLVVAEDETDGLDDDRVPIRDWLTRARPRGARTTIETALALFERSGHAESVQVELFERPGVPVRYRLGSPGQGKAEVAIPVPRVHWQRGEIPRERFPLAPLIRAPLPAPRPLPIARARPLLRAAHAALCARNLEIYPLIYANPRDTWHVRGDRGIDVVLVGTRPAWRSPLEALYVFLVCKNGVPLGYGPAGVACGACEMGINLFPEFRGAEIRFVWAQIMRVLHQVLGADYFFLQPYGMGVDNPEAIASGAFWFYRKLGFLAENPNVEALARAEEARMARDPRYRSDRAMLHRLKHTRAVFDLSGGRHRWLDLGALSLGVTESLRRRFGGDRGPGRRACAAALARTLGVHLARWPAAERDAFALVAPLLTLIPEVRRWPAVDRRALARACRGKGAPSEAAAARAFARMERLAPTLHEAARRYAPAT